jgi:outer membrane lipoprotein SlyB
LIGGLAGGGKGSLIGGLIGGGAGTAGAAFTGNKPLVIPTESIVVFELTQPLSITVEK